MSGDPGPLSIAVTGGIGSGKSTAAAVLADLGALVVDSDRLAREVVAPGTPGLAAVAAEFGRSVVTVDGTLDRAALAGIVFSDPEARRRLEAITHPLVRAEFDRQRDAAPASALVVNDIPLLRSLDVAAGFHLVLGVGAEEGRRVARLARRGLAASDARARIRSQITDDERRTLSDVWIDNEDSEHDLRDAVARLWTTRLVPFASNRLAGRTAARGPAVLRDPDPEWPTMATLLGARVSAAAGGLPVEHIGSTSIRGLPAKDVIDLQLVVADLNAADRLAHPLASAGFPRVPGRFVDNVHAAPGVPGSSATAGWDKRLHANADPGRSVNLHVRVRDAPNRRHAVLFRDWLRAVPAARDEYLAVKRDLAVRFAGDGDAARYAEAKEPWFSAAAPRAEAWAAAGGWALPADGSQDVGGSA